MSQTALWQLQEWIQSEMKGSDGRAPLNESAGKEMLAKIQSLLEAEKEQIDRSNKMGFMNAIIEIVVRDGFSTSVEEALKAGGLGKYDDCIDLVAEDNYSKVILLKFKDYFNK